MQPSLKFLKTFLTAARLGSFKAAGEDLCITASAVSHQMKTLESQLGVALFERGAQSLTLTDAGLQYRELLAVAFAHLDDATDRIRAGYSHVPVHLSAPPFFTSELLLPSLPAFRTAHPDIELHITTRLASQDFSAAGTDISIMVGVGPWAAFVATKLFPQVFGLACAPQLLREITSAAEASADYALLVHTHRPLLWDQWVGTHGDSTVLRRRRLGFDSMQAIVDAAEHGVGIGLVSLPVAKARLAAGTLVRVTEQELDTAEHYFVLCRPEIASRTSVALVIDWLVHRFRTAKQACDT